MNNNKYLTYFSLIFLAFISLSAQALTELTASVDRNPVMENESFVLQIVANDSLDSSELDLSALTRSGLVVGRTSTSSQTQIINGNISKTTTWSTVLIARQAGSYTIPAVSINGATTSPINVDVIKASGQSGQNTQAIFLKNTIESNELYLQQSVRLITRLYFAPNVDLQSGTLTDPNLDGAIIKQQGKDKETSEIVMGMRYRVIERTYTLTPQASGEFTIASPSFNGEVSTDRRRSVFSAFGNRKPVSSIGNDLKIKVSPIPNDYQGSWLPSDLVQLNDEIQPQQEVYQIGEPITRTFTLTALNVNEEQLPELKGSYPDTFNLYPDQSETRSVLRQNAIVSQRVSSEAIVPTQPGVYTLPAVSVNWFNTKTLQVETATIPAKQIRVEASNEQGDNTLVTNLPVEQQTINTQSCPEVTTDAPSCPELIELAGNNLWLTISGWALWLLTLLIILIKKLSGKKSAPVEIKAEKTFNATDLNSACKLNDAARTRALLIKWGQEHFDDSISTLSDLKNYVSDEFAKEIDVLNQNQYSTNKADWNGSNLARLVKQHKPNKQAKKQSGLPPLN